MNQAPLARPCFLDLGPRAVWELRGPDAVRYLNGQVTNDVARLSAGHTLRAFVTDPKGHLQAELRIVRRPGESLLVEAPRELRESLAARLTRYLVADEVEVTDVSDAWRVYHLLDPSGESSARWAGAGAALAAESLRLGVPGQDWWVAAALTATAEPALRQIALPLEPEFAEALRIRHGVAAWGRELLPGMLAPEAGIESDAICYRKGCYVGQEVISRIRSAGKLPRSLARFALPASLAAPRAEGASLLPAGSAQTAGTITSVSPVPEPGTASRPALGFLRREAAGHSTFDLLLADGTRLPAAACLAAATDD